MYTNGCYRLLANAAMGSKSHYKFLNSTLPMACRNVSVLLTHFAPSGPFRWTKLRLFSLIIPSWKPNVLQLCIPRNKEVFIMCPSNLSHYIFKTNIRNKSWMDKNPIFIKNNHCFITNQSNKTHLHHNC